MKIIIAGAGKIGFYLAKLLSYESHDTFIIDKDKDKLAYAESHLDVITKKGDATSIKVLKEIGVAKADILLALTDCQNANFTVCVIGKALGVKKTIAKIKNPEFLKTNDLDFSKYGIDFMISPEKLAASEIKLLLSNSTFNENIAFENGVFNVVGAILGSKSSIVDLNVREAKKLHQGVDFIIIAIRRDTEVIIPRGNTVFQENDQVYFSVPHYSIDKLYDIVGKKQEDIKDVMILGGSSIGKKSAKMLSETQYNVKLFEQDKLKAHRIAESISNVLVINGDGTDYEILEENGIRNTDAFLAMTRDSETNIISCLVAKSKGVKKTIALVENMDYLNISREVGVNTLVNKKLIAAGNIFRHIRKGDILAMANLRNVDAEVLEFEAHENDKVTKVPIKDLKFPREAVFGGIIRNGSPLMSFGDVQIQQGDKVIVFCTCNVIEEVESFFNV